MTIFYKKTMFLPKLVGKMLVFLVFANFVSSLNASAAPNDQNPRPLLQKNMPLHQGFYNGYKGYRHNRFGYQRHSDGWWYPKAAFDNTRSAPPYPVASKPQANKPNQQTTPPREALSQRQIRWCIENYRSYRPSDNSFVNFQGQRKYCTPRFKN